MATVGGVTSGQQAGQTTDPITPAKAAAADPLANQSTFLTLLVSQLKNQNPTSPMDGTTFVTQLAQFSELQQNLAIRQDADSLSEKLTGTNSLTPADSSSSTGATSGSGS